MVVGLHIHEHEMNGVKVLRLEGRLDAVSSSALEKQLSTYYQGHPKGIVLDFTKVEYLSSAGMRVMLSATKKFKNQGGILALCALHDDVMEIIRLAGFEKLLSIHSLEKDAVEAVKFKH